MANADGTDWDAASPADSALVSAYPAETRALRAAVKLRNDKEHVAAATASAGGQHKAGSAVIYTAAASAPTQQPDASTALGVSDTGRLYFDTTNKKLYYWSGSAWVLLTVERQSFARLEERTSGQGGTFTSGAWRTRALNTERNDSDSIVSLSGSAFTLGAGRYIIRGGAVAYQVNGHKVRLYDVTASAAILEGFPAFSGADPNQSQACSEFETEVNPSGSNVYRLEHLCETTKATNGLGNRAVNSDSDTYSWVSIVRISR